MEQKFLHEIERLNPEQRNAVDTIYGPVMVIAGPGTGKTQVLTLRIANILDKTDLGPENILALTFTETAAYNMRKRLLPIIGESVYKTNINTFHGFANEIIQENQDKITWQKDLAQIDDIARIKIVREILDGESFDLLKPFGNPYMYTNDLIRSISILKKEAVDYDSFINIVQRKEKDLEIEKSERARKKNWKKEDDQIKKLFEVAEFYKIYSGKLKSEGYYDYDDMILFAVELLKNNQDLLLDYRERYQFVLVDEFQDTNGSQLELAITLAGKIEKPNLFVVGDDDQAIYRFQGANVGNLIGFREMYSESKIITLKQNYRSTEKIIDSSKYVIDAVQSRITNLFPDIEKDLFPHRSGGENPELNEQELQIDESIFVAEKIQSLIDSGARPRDIAVLYRKNSDVEEVKNTFQKLGIPFQISGRFDILKTKFVQKIVSILNLVHNPENSEDIFSLLHDPAFEISTLDIYKLQSSFKEVLISLFRYIDGDLKEAGLETVLNAFGLKSTVGFLRVGDLLKICREMQDITLSEIFIKALNESNIIDYLLRNKLLTELHLLNQFYSFVKNAELSNPKISLGEFLNDLDILSQEKLGISGTPLPQDFDAVQISTIHSAKGLEYENVFLIGASESSWEKSRVPNKIKLPDEVVRNYVNLEEEKNDDERRIFYVGVTRAKSRLFISYPKKKLEDDKEKLPTVFLSGVKNIENKKSEIDTISKARAIFSLPEAPERGKEMRRYLKKLTENLSINATSLNTYLECPKRFLYRHLLRVPDVKSRDQALGTAIHKAFELFYKRITKGFQPNLDFLTMSFDQSIRKENLSDRDLADSLAEGSKLLENYYKNYEGGFSPPLELEYGFGFKNIYLDDIRLTGKIDKIELISDERIRVVDYKTSKPKTDGEIRGTTKNSNGNIYRQLIFYKLLLSLDKKFKYDPTEFEIDFVKPKPNGEYKKLRFAISDTEVGELKILIGEVVEKIRNLEFPDGNDEKLCERRDCICRKIG